jgi:hypothetical protein
VRSKPRGGFHPALLLPLLAAFPLTFLFVMLVANYWDQYEIGELGGNSFALLFLYAPVSFAAFLGTALVGFLLLRRVRLGPWVAAFLSCIGMALLFIGGFACEVWRTADYPTQIQTPIGVFLKDFVHDTRERFKL